MTMDRIERSYFMDEFMNWLEYPGKDYNMRSDIGFRLNILLY